MKKTLVGVVWLSLAVTAVGGMLYLATGRGDPQTARSGDGRGLPFAADGRPMLPETGASAAAGPRRSDRWPDGRRGERGRHGDREGHGRFSLARGIGGVGVTALQLGALAAVVVALQRRQRRPTPVPGPSEKGARS